MPGTLFVSDLHIDPSRPRITQLFLEVLETLGKEADAVYLLGDLFEIWLGDDDDNPVGQAVAEGLGACTAAGVPVHLMRGNRDFLMGARFAARCGCRLLDDPARINLYGSPAVLTHGDQLCTDDVEYQTFRSTVRDPRWQEAARRAAAQALRMKSRARARDKSETITDVNHDAVLQLMTGHGVRLLIHGHTHRPGMHTFEIGDKPARRIVLGDWYRQGSVLECTPRDCRLRYLPID